VGSCVVSEPEQIVDLFEFTVTGEPGRVVLVARQQVTTFVRETIPDGVMAGMIGHRPVQHEREFVFEIPTQQARRLLDDLARQVPYAEQYR
jgi:hypothetical protein